MHLFTLIQMHTDDLAQLVRVFGFVTKHHPKFMYQDEKVRDRLLKRDEFIEPTDGVIKCTEIEEMEYCPACAHNVYLGVEYECEDLGQLHFCSPLCVKSYRTGKIDYSTYKVAENRAKEIYREVYEL